VLGPRRPYTCTDCPHCWTREVLSGHGGAGVIGTAGRADQRTDRSRVNRTRSHRCLLCEVLETTIAVGTDIGFPAATSRHVEEPICSKSAVDRSRRVRFRLLLRMSQTI